MVSPQKEAPLVAQRRRGFPESTGREFDELSGKYDITDAVVEAFEISVSNGKLTDANFEKFKKYCMSKAEPKKSMPTPLTKKRPSSDFLTPAPQVKKEKVTIWSPGLPTPSGGDRQGAKVATQFNADLAPAPAQPRAPNDTDWLQVESCASHRGLALAPQTIAKALMNRCDRLEPGLLAAASVDSDGSELPTIKVGDTNTNRCVVIGRICSGSEAAGDFKLAEKSLVLEGTRSSNHYRMELETSACPDLRVFPGQVVAAVGKTDPKGVKFHAETVVPGLPLPARQPHQVSEPTSFVVAAGPFTKANSLDFEVLDALIAYVSEKKPRAVVVMGPLLDIANRRVATGTLRKHDQGGELMSFEDVYNGGENFDGVFDKLRRLAELGPQVVLVPHLSETGPLCPMLPQPPYAMADGTSYTFAGDKWKALLKKQNLRLASNPCTLVVGGVRIAVTSTDPMVPLISDHVNKTAQKPVEFALEMLLAQRCFFPAHPAPRGSPAGRVAFGRFEDLEFFDPPPDMLFIASKLKEGVKCFGEKDSARVLVNPGLASKENSWGTIAEVHLAPEKAGPDVQDLSKSVRVDIIKL
jgi:hypothetical protein